MRTHPQYADHAAAYDLKHLHDFRLVWALEIPERTSFQSDPHQLDDCFLRILLPGPGQPYRLLRIHRGTALDHSGSHHACRFFCLLGALPEAAYSMEPRGGLWHDRRRRRSDLQTIVPGVGLDPTDLAVSHASVGLGV
jgi:hypothetical protein